MRGLLRKGQELSREPAPWATSTAIHQGGPNANTAAAMQMPAQVNNAAIYFEGLLATFLVAYLPSSSIVPPTRSHILMPAVPWMQIAIALPSRGPVLSIALQALCLTKFARVNGDTSLLTQGMAMHGRALGTLQTAIRNRDAVLTDETLAAIRVLGTYELYEGTMGSVVGWTSHEEGVDKLIQLRGFRSSQYESYLGEALFAEARRSAVSVFQLL